MGKSLRPNDDVDVALEQPRQQGPAPPKPSASRSRSRSRSPGREAAPEKGLRCQDGEGASAAGAADPAAEVGAAARKARKQRQAVREKALEEERLQRLTRAIAARRPGSGGSNGHSGDGHGSNGHGGDRAAPAAAAATPQEEEASTGGGRGERPAGPRVSLFQPDDVQSRWADEIEAAASLQSLAESVAAARGALQDGGVAARALPAAAVLRRLPDLLALAELSTLEALTKRLDAGGSVEASPLPSKRPTAAAAGEPGAAALAFLWAHDAVAEILDTSELRAAVPLSWLADVASFYGEMRPGPPPAKHVLEDCADEALKRLRRSRSAASPSVDDLESLCQIARGVAVSGMMARHEFYAELTGQVTDALRRSAGKAPGGAALHAAAIALALARPWDAGTAARAGELRTQLDQRAPGGGRGAAATARPKAAAAAAASVGQQGWSAGALAGTSVAGMRYGEPKENQDVFHAARHGDSVVMAVVDGHGKNGAELAAAALRGLERSLPRLPTAAAGPALADAIMVCDAGVLLSPEIDAELSGASCVMARVESLSRPLGGGPGVAPGLAMSRGFGDALGKACGFSARATTAELGLEEGDAVLVAASDGVFDVLSDAEVLHCCRVFWAEKGAAEAAAAIVAAAGRGWASRGGGYRDDATCAVLFL